MTGKLNYIRKTVTLRKMYRNNAYNSIIYSI